MSEDRSPYKTDQDELQRLQEEALGWETIANWYRTALELVEKLTKDPVKYEQWELSHRMTHIIAENALEAIGKGWEHE